MNEETPSIPIAVNFHLYKPCNYRCRFCFATYRDIRGRLSLPEAKLLLQTLRGAGCDKLTFAGGEPTLHPNIGELVAEAKRFGLVVTIITNGARLDNLLDEHAADIDWVGLSVDSGDEDIQADLARVLRRVDGLLEAKFSAAQAAGTFAAGADCRLAAQVAQGVLHSLAIRARAGASRKALERMADFAVSALVGYAPDAV